MNMIKQCFASQYNELSHLASCVTRDDVFDTLRVPHGLCYFDTILMKLE